jgi:hypothetical protein
MTRLFAAGMMSVFVLASTTACSQAGPTGPTSARGTLQIAGGTGVTASTVIDNSRAHAPISFTLGGCPNLPAGLTVSGTGDDFLVVNSRVDSQGVTHMERNDLVIGTATDSNGASYKFNYHNHSNITIPPGGFPWSFTTADHFNLIGNGQANQLQVTFVARVTFSSPTDPPDIEFVNERGDPFFCDPI